MNYIVHLFLSEFDDGLVVGNFIGDDIKGKNYLQYSESIQKGILLHRNIDTFTDNHPIIRKSKTLLVPTYNHWSGVLIDIFFGYFLVLNWKKYSNETIKEFAERVHQVLLNSYLDLTPNAQQFLDYIIQYDRIMNFDKIKTVDEVLKSMAGRTNQVSNIENASQDLLFFYEELNQNFNLFLPELIQFTKNKILNHDF